MAWSEFGDLLFLYIFPWGNKIVNFRNIDDIAKRNRTPNTLNI